MAEPCRPQLDVTEQRRHDWARIIGKALQAVSHGRLVVDGARNTTSPPHPLSFRTLGARASSPRAEGEESAPPRTDVHLTAAPIRLATTTTMNKIPAQG